MLEEIRHNNLILSVIIRADYHKEGISFFTPNNFSQQLGYMNRSAGYIIPPHVHNIVPRNVDLTQEVLFIRSGKVRVDFYDNEKKYLESRILNKGDVILLAHGGHGFEMIEQSEMIEVKQGPYCGEEDKVRFEPINQNETKIKS